MGGRRGGGIFFFLSLEALGSVCSEVTGMLGGGQFNGDKTTAGGRGSDNMTRESVLVTLMVDGGRIQKEKKVLQPVIQ